jgi:hypothetical protein
VAKNGLRLDGVSEGGSCAVSLDDVDVLWREPCAVERLPNDTLLGRAIGSGEALASAVLVDGGPSKDGEDGMTVSDSIGEALEQEHPGASAQPAPLASAENDLQRPSGAGLAGD